MTGAEAPVSGRSRLLLIVSAVLLGLLLFLALAAAWRIAPDLGHGWAAFPLIAYLYWERWPERPPARAPGPVGASWWWAAVLLGAAGAFLQLLLIPYPLWAGVLWSYTALLAGAVLAGAWLTAGRRGVGWWGGPLILLAAALPWPHRLQEGAIQPLRVGLAGLAAEVCTALGRPALAEGAAVQLGGGWVGIDEACGGIRSLQAAALLALFLGEWLRLAWMRRAALVLASVAAALLGNFLRILFLSLWMSAGTAPTDLVHDAAGWLALSFTLALTGLAAWRWDSKVGPDRPSSPGYAGASRAGRNRRGTQPARPAVGPYHAAVWLSAVAGFLALAEVGDRGWFWLGESRRDPRLVWEARLPTDDPSFRPAQLPDAAREMLRPDAFSGGSWRDGAGRQRYAYYVVWKTGQAARYAPFFHNPTVCLPMSGCEMTRELGTLSVPWKGRIIPFHAYLFRRAGTDLAVAFAVWDNARSRPLDPPPPAGWLAWMRSQWRDVREGRASQPAQMLALAIEGDSEQLGSGLRELIAAPRRNG